MPVYFNHRLAVSASELVEFGLFSTKHQVSKKCTRDKKRGFGLVRLREGKGSGNDTLIDFYSLPKIMQEIIGDPSKITNIIQNYYSEDSEAYRYYSNADGNGFTYPDGSSLLAATIDQLHVNASVMLAAVDLAKDREIEWVNKGRSTRSLVKSVHEDVVLFNEILSEQNKLTHSLPSTYRRFKETYRSFKSAVNPFYTLIKDPEGKRKKNAEKCDVKHQELLNALFTSQSSKPHFTKVARQYKAFLNGRLDIFHTNREGIEGLQFKPEEFNDISISTIKSELRKWENKIGTYAKRSGNSQKLIADFVPYHSFERPKFAGSLLSIDDRVPPFWYDKDRSRMWFYIGMDVASGAFTCFVWGKDKKGLILDFYRQMVRVYANLGWNLPYELEAELALNSEYKETLLKPGVMFEETHIIPNNARGKRIEREFGKIRYEIEKERAGWIARPFAKSEHNQEGSDKIKIIPYDRLVMQCIEDIAKLNELPHPTQPELTRWEYAMKFQNPDLKPTNYKSILNYIGFETSTSCNVGRVSLQNQKWLIGDNATLCTGEELIQKMELIEGKSVNVKWLDNVRGGVLKAMVFIDGRYICELIPEIKTQKAKAEQTKEDAELMGKFKAYQKTITNFQKLRKGQIEEVYIQEKIEKKAKTFDLSLHGINLERYQSTEEKIEVVNKRELEEEHGEEIHEQSYKTRNWQDQFKI